MGLDTILEAARYLEYQAELNARVVQAFQDTRSGPSQSGSNIVISMGPSQPVPVMPPNVPHEFRFADKTEVGYILQSLGTTFRPGPAPVDGYQCPQSKSLEGTSVTDRISKTPAPATANVGIKSEVRTEKNCDKNEKKIKVRMEHNKLEKLRRDNLNESFNKLVRCLPVTDGYRHGSKATILKNCLDLINKLKQDGETNKTELEQLAHRNTMLKEKYAALTVIGEGDHKLPEHPVKKEEEEILERVPKQEPFPNDDKNDSGFESQCCEDVKQTAETDDGQPINKPSFADDSGIAGQLECHEVMELEEDIRA